ncbi:hypothetical protein ACLOJK_008020 [Asimina triloba]
MGCRSEIASAPRKQKEKEKEKGIDGLDGEDEKFLVDRYESGEEGTMDGGGLKRRDRRNCFSSSEDEDDDADWDEEGKVDKNMVKVYFCSRTHSQLSQFVKELRKTAFSSVMKAVCLGFRKSFCINSGHHLIKMYFPTVYNIKHLMKFYNNLHGGLNKLAELLEVERVGICHQAGFDNLLTSSTFRKLKESFFNKSIERYAANAILLLSNFCTMSEFGGQ